MSHPQPPPPLPPFQPPIQTKKKRSGLALLVTAAITAALAGSCGLAVGGSGGDSMSAATPGPTVTITATETATASAAAPTTSEPDPTEDATTEEPDSFKPKKADFEVRLRTKRKQCFGSAGCNVTVGINPRYVGSQTLPDTGTIEVTYEISGDESGPVTNTFTVEGGKASYTAEEDISTPSSSTKVKGKITDVSYDGG